jgi:acyl-CoA reductase-like NAD-dependent aldehyde dehydrogenase
MSDFSLMIDGAKVTTEQSFGVVNPATGQVFSQCPLATPEHVDQAVNAARKAFVTWSALGDKKRQQMIRDVADILEKHSEELAQLLVQEQGKPMGGFAGLGAGFELGGAVAWCRATAELDLPVDVIEDNDESRIEVHRRPLGVVGSITPWNYPVMIAIWHVMPALRSGNTVVLKPSSYTPLSTLRMVEIINQVLPAGVLNVITGDAEVGDAMTGHQGINKIVFTGSTRTGKQIMKNSSGTLKRLTLELGGNDAAIILPDSDVKAIAPKVFATTFINNGQTCAALKRLYVHADIYDEMCDALTSIANSVKTGNGMDEGIDFGPVQNKTQLNIVRELADDAKKAGARFLTGGEAPDGDGYFYPITLVADVTDGCRLVDEEPFGPILPIIKFTDVEDAITRANASSNGLGGSVWSADVEKATALASRLECGTAWVNNHAMLHPGAPFGGVKESGFGVEFGRYGLEEYTSIQTMQISKK